MQAQFGKRLGKAIENAAKKTVERKAEQKTEEAVEKGIDKATNPETYNDNGKDNGKVEAKQTGGEANNTGDAEKKTSEPGVSTPVIDVKAVEMAYAKSDFVPGDEIFFDDDHAKEQFGEFPSQWDLIKGNAEIAEINGEKCIYMIDNETTIVPLMKDMKNYLPDKFTVEFDYFVRDRVHIKKKTTGYESIGLLYFQLVLNKEYNKEVTRTEHKVFSMQWSPHNMETALRTE
jgi:hypothetical protein